MATIFIIYLADGNVSVFARTWQFSRNYVVPIKGKFHIYIPTFHDIVASLLSHVSRQ